MDFHSILGKLRAIESLGRRDSVFEAEECNMTAEGEQCPVHGMEECAGYQGSIQMETDMDESACNMTAEGEMCPVHGVEECWAQGPMEENASERDDHAEKAGRKVAHDIEYDERHKDRIHGAKRGSEDDKAERAGRRVTKDIEWDEMNEESDITRDDRAERAGRKVAHDIEYDERDKDDIHGRRRGSEDDKAERAGRRVTKDIEWDEMSEGSENAIRRMIDMLEASYRETRGEMMDEAPITTAMGDVAGDDGTDDVGAQSKSGLSAGVVDLGAGQQLPVKDRGAGIGTIGSAQASDAPPQSQGYHAGTGAGPNTQATNGKIDSMSFDKAFAAARKVAGGNGGVFTWKGKQYQTTLKGEQGLPWNSTKLKNVDDQLGSMEEDAALGGFPFTPIGATNNGPDTQGFVYAYNESQKQLRESMNIVMNQTIGDGNSTRSVTVTATDEDANDLVRMLVKAGLAGSNDMHQDAEASTPGMPYGVADAVPVAVAAMENADHDHGHEEHPEAGEPLEVKDYEWDGPHINQRFGKIGDNTLMAERADSLFAALNEEYSSFLAEAELAPSNASGAESPLTANARDAFDKDPFADEEPVTDGSRSPLSHIGRQDVMN